MPTQAITQLGVSGIIVVFMAIAIMYLWKTLQAVREDRNALADRLIDNAEKSAPLLARATELMAEVSLILRDLRDNAIRAAREK